MGTALPRNPDQPTALTMNRRRFAFLVIASLAATASLARAAYAQTVTSAMTGAMTGADRTSRLIEGTEKEGVVSIYSSAAVEDMTPLVAAFEKKYGIRVRVWRAASSDILQRALTEARAGRSDVDIIETGRGEMEALAREGLFQAVNSPFFADVMGEARLPRAPYVGSRLMIYNVAYNTKLVRRADAPKTYQDFLDPKWKGKIGIESSDSNWFMSLVTHMGEEKGVSLFREIAAKNGLSVRRGHTLLTSLVISGEVPIALNVFRHEVRGMKQAGAPIEEVNLSPSIADMAAAGVTARAPPPLCRHAVCRFSVQRRTEDLGRSRARADVPQIPGLAGGPKAGFHRRHAVCAREWHMGAVVPRGTDAPLEYA